MKQTKVIHPFDEQDYNGIFRKVFIKIEYSEDGRLSLSGVVGPKSNGDCFGSCGQIIMGYFNEDTIICNERIEKDTSGKHAYLSATIKDNTLDHESSLEIRLSPKWTIEMIDTLFRLWDLYHLNDMKAGCEHQLAFGWDKRKLDKSKPIGWSVDNHANLQQWAYPSEGGILMQKCPICGYKYGSAWKKMDVPAWAIDYLFNLPETDVTPAWV